MLQIWAGVADCRYIRVLKKLRQGAQSWYWKSNCFWMSYNDEDRLRSLMLVEWALLQDNVNG